MHHMSNFFFQPNRFSSFRSPQMLSWFRNVTHVSTKKWTHFVNVLGYRHPISFQFCVASREHLNFSRVTCPIRIPFVHPRHKTALISWSGQGGRGLCFLYRFLDLSEGSILTRKQNCEYSNLKISVSLHRFFWLVLPIDRNHHSFIW